jgi:serine/threonine protein kinase/tetratricopeptide (TPR) repeat protein
VTKIGQTISHYKITGTLGRGGMGLIYEAKDTRLDRSVALKFLPDELLSSTAAKDRFQREARAASALSHPNICIVHDMGEHDGDPFMVMERLEGSTLDEKIGSSSFDTKDLIDAAIQIAKGLEAAHSRGILHRDIKPSNIFITRDGFVKILDFGLAKLNKHQEVAPEDRPTELTGVGALLGTVKYLSPEQALNRRVDERSDLFSLGLVYYQMATGHHPFEEDSSVGIINALINKEPIPIKQRTGDVPAGFVRIVNRLLAKNPEERYQSASDLLEDLEAVSSGRRVSETWLGVLFDPRNLFPIFTIITITALALWLALWWTPVPPASTPINWNRLVLLPLSYEGPPEKANVATMLPALLYESLRSNSGLETVSFDTSRSYAPEVEYTLVAKELGADWVLKGSLEIDGSEYAANWELLGPGKTVHWDEVRRGDVSEIFSAAELASREISQTLGEFDSSSEDSSRPSSDAVRSYLVGKSYLEGWDVEHSYERAEEAFQQAIEADNGFAQAHAGLALAYWDQWELTQDPDAVSRAFREAEKAVLLAPDHPDSHLAMGVVQLGRGRFEEAIQSFETVLELAPADDAACRQIGQTYEGLGKYEEAREMYQRAVDLNPGFWQNYLALGNFLLYRGEFEKAKAPYRKLISLRPKSDIGHNNLALTHLSLGEMEEAEVHLFAALAIQPDPSSYNNLGFIYYSQGRYEEAAEQFRKATQLGPEQEAWVNLGDAYRQLKRQEPAREAYAKATEMITVQLQINPSDSGLRATLAYSLAGVGRCEEALREVDRVNEADPSNPLSHYYLAIAAALCEANGTAIQHIKVAAGGGLVADVKTNPDLEPLLADPALAGVLAGEGKR